MSEFKDKTSIITGGTGELGRVVVDRFAEEGMKIYVPTQTIDKFREIFDSSKSENSKEFKLRKIYGLQCDAINEDSVKNFISDVLKAEGRIDYLINTVGGFHKKTNIVDMDSGLVDKMLDLNFKSTFYFCKNVLKSMIEHNYGKIVAIGAMPALEISAGRLAYSVSKSSVINLIQTIAEETKENNITANVIVPSIINTAPNRESMPKADFNKWVKPEDIAETILFLLSDKAASYRGSVIKMYGGV
jgi:NAD(P)-dependent dehydrogenase (short-subunit alcohol dehydrogenase family)